MPSAFRILLYFISNIPITQLQISCKKLCVALLSIMHHPANTRLGKKRVEAVLKTSWKMKNCYAEDMLKTSSRRFEDEQMFAGNKSIKILSKLRF